MDIMNFEEKKDLEVNKLEIKENLFDMQKLILRLKNLIKIISEEQKNFYKIHHHYNMSAINKNVYYQE